MDAERSRHGSQLDKLRATHDRLQHDLDKARQERNSAREMLALTEGSLAEARAAHEDVRDECTEWQARVTRADQGVTQAMAAAEAAKLEAVEARAARVHAESRVANLVAELETAQASAATERAAHHGRSVAERRHHPRPAGKYARL